MAAKSGETAPEDIVIEKGPQASSRAPLSVNSSRQAFLRQLKVARSRSARPRPLSRKAQSFQLKLADVLVKLDIKPMDVGLALQAAFHDGSIYEPSVLAVDETKILAQIQLASQQAFNLSVNAVYPDQGDHGTDPDKGSQGGTWLSDSRHQSTRKTLSMRLLVKPREKAR